jgi:lipid II:glycine glycyltransferase (peptidoglycan interpeptide bridge formation enzyme)
VAVHALDINSETPGRWTTESPARSAIDEQWDQFVEATPGGDLVQTTAWAQTKRALGFEVCRVTLRRGDEISGGAQIVVKRFGPLGGVGYIARGPLAGNRTPEQVGQVLAEIERSARSKKIRHLIIQPPADGADIAAALAARGYTGNAPAVAPTATIRIDLSHSLDQILAGMSEKRRREVRRAMRLGIEVKLGGRSDIDAFHAMHEATAHRQGFVPLSRQYLERQWDVLHPRGWLHLFLAYNKGRPQAGIWSTPFGDTITDRIAGWTGEERNLPLNVACVWSVIQWAKAHGYRYYDQGGVDRRYAAQRAAGQPLQEEALASPAGFKMLFGGEPILMPTASQYTFNPILRLLGRVVLTQLARGKSLKRITHRLRNG